MNRRRVMVAVTTLFGLSAATALAAPGDIERISRDTGGGDPNFMGGGSFSGHPSLSGDGSVVAFYSIADDLVSGDTNAFQDVFARGSGQTERASLSDADAQSTGGDAVQPSISADGSLVAFTSSSPTLGAGVPAGRSDIFLRDLDAGTTVRLSVVGATGDPDGSSTRPAISADGSVVAFASTATDLVVAPGNGAVADVFVRDGVDNELISVDVAPTDGANGPSGNPVVVTGGGLDAVAFDSTASDLVAGDGNGVSDVFVRDRIGATTTRVSVNSSEAEANGGSDSPSLSADGRYVAFRSSATNLTGDGGSGGGVYVRDTVLGTTERIDLTHNGLVPTGFAIAPAISADGRYVAFASTGDRLVSGDTNSLRDVFVRDRQLDRTVRVSVPAAGGQGADFSGGSPPSNLDGVAISADASRVAFESEANNLVPGDGLDPFTSPYFQVFATEVDFAPPVTFIGVPPATTARTFSVPFSSNRSGTTAFECRLDAGAFAPCSSPMQLSNLGLGAHSVSVRSRNRFGTSGTTQASFTVQQPAAPANPAPPPPVFRTSFNLEPVSGAVFVTVPGGRRVRIQDVIQVPSGSLVDTRRGRVRLFAAATRRGSKIVSSEFFDGLFRVVQLKDGITELRLAGGSFKGCATTAKRSSVRTAARKRRRIRRLWGKGKGRFRTRGKHAAALVRGTTWLVEDRCDGTLVAVRVGSVTVSDFAKRKRLVLRKGKRYLARPRGRR